jgi:hypothetical protein
MDWGVGFDSVLQFGKVNIFGEYDCLISFVCWDDDDGLVLFQGLDSSPFFWGEVASRWVRYLCFRCMCSISMHYSVA